MGWFHRDLRKEIEEILDSLQRDAIRIPEQWKWLKRSDYKLHEIDELDLELMRELKKLHKKGLGNPKLAGLIFLKARQLHDYLRSMINQQYLDPKTQKREIELVRAMIKEIEDLFKQELEYEKAYERIIVSHSGIITFLHRTSLDRAIGILKEGIRCASADITTTADIQSVDLENARRNFERRHHNDNVVVVIQIPNSLWLNAKRKYKQMNELSDPNLATYNRNEDIPITYDKPYVLKPEFIVGYIDRRDNSVHLNPRYKGLVI